ncbi:ABC-three component system middle component 6 [Arenibacter troitsensis]|uniref:Uncharacterized protein n=1 Tax=Arenibacter troitsensis TaxID=188872 RepID=A0A1X7J963_9FLAO|nr:hypothetical protein SAMN03080602_01452 [Arenibacter troitsensis]
MIVSNNIAPDKNLYYLGSEILKILHRFENRLDLILLFDKLNEYVKVTFVLYTYSLDWLYLSGLIENDKKGTIIRCI